MPREDLRTRLGRDGLKSLMRDPRYLDGNHPEHKRVLAMVTHAFELVFDETPGRAGGDARSPDPFSRSLAQSGVTEQALPRTGSPQRAALGRAVVLNALEADGVELPRGFREETAEPNGPLARLNEAASTSGSSTPRPPGAKRNELRTTLLSSSRRNDESSARRESDLLGRADSSQGQTPGPTQRRPPVQQASVKNARPKPKPKPFMLSPTNPRNRAFRDDLLAFLRQPGIEGEVEFAYDDDVFPSQPVTPTTKVTGNLTIGIGVKIDDDAKKWLKVVGADLSKILAGKETLNKQQREELATLAAARTTRFLSGHFEDVLDTIDRQEWLALMSLAYNSPGLIGPGLSQAVRDRDVDSAVWEIACNSGGNQDRRAKEAATYANVPTIDRKKTCRTGRPSPLR